MVQFVRKALPSVGITLALCLGAGSLSSVRAQTSPAQPSAELTQGKSLYKSGDTSGAIAALHSAVKVQGDNAEAWLFLGLALNRDGQIQEARKAFEKSVNLQPGNATAQAALAYALLTEGRTEDATRAVRSALALNAGNIEAQYVMGAVRLRERKFEEAATWTDTLLKSQPNYRPALLLKAQISFSSFAKLHADGRKQQVGKNGKGETEQQKQATEERLRKELNLLNDAAATLEEFIKLTPNPSEQAKHRETIENLRVYARLIEQPNDSVDWGGDATRPVITYKERVKVTEEAHRAGVQGSVVLLAIFAADGTVQNILPVQGLSHGLTEQSILATRKIRFKPAMKNGRPVSVVLEVEYNFQRY